MSSSDGISTCDISKPACGEGVSVSTSNKKECTSCEQKIDDCKLRDGASDNSDDATGSNCNSDIGTVVEGISRVDISNDNNNTGSSSNTVSTNCISQDMDEKMKLSDDEKLFAEPPPKEECPICMLSMPHAVGLCGVGMTYMSCCGKFICIGCIMESEIGMKKGNMKWLCAFCRVPYPRSDEEIMMQMTNRIGTNDPEAMHELGSAYYRGRAGFPQDYRKAVELWTKAAELGCARAHYALAGAYVRGQGVEANKEKGIRHLKAAAGGGHEYARYNLGLFEERNGNIDRAMKHFIIAARSGLEEALKKVAERCKDGYVTKDECATTLRAYQDSCEDMKSEPRARAVTFWD